MEPIPPDAAFLIKLIGQTIDVRSAREGLMKSGIKNCDHRYTREAVPEIHTAEGWLRALRPTEVGEREPD